MTLNELLRTAKPVIAMAHLPALPGSPRHERGSARSAIVERVREDLQHLFAAGVDAVMFCNEDDRPYQLHADPATVASMASIVSEVAPTDRPFGVDVLWDPMATLAVAKATGAAFIREVVTGVYESDMGMWAPDAAALFRYRASIDAENVLVLANVTPEFASPLGSRSVAQRARSALVSSLVDAILVSGAMAGAEPNLDDIGAVRESVAGAVPVLMNTGATAANIGRFLEVADGVIVGSGLKVGGYTWNPVDPVRVAEFMKQVLAARGRARQAG